MALTAKQQKTRLDFAASIDEAVPSINNKEVVVTPEKEEKKTEKPVELKEEKTEKIEKTKPEKQEKAEEKTVEKKAKVKKAVEEQPLDDLSAILASLRKNETGVQKSIYIDRDVHEFIDEMSKKNGTKYSTTLNTLLKIAISQFKK